MSVISDLIDKVNDPDLRARLNEEVARMQKQKKFGLVCALCLFTFSEVQQKKI